MVIVCTQSATSSGLSSRIIFFAEIVYFFIDYQSEKFNLQSKYMQEFDQPKNEKPEFLALPPWSEEMELVLQIIQNSFPVINPRFEFIDKLNPIRAKIESQLGENHVLAISCLGRNELQNFLIFKIFISVKGKDFQMHTLNKNVNIPTDDKGNIYDGLLLTKMGKVIDDVLQNFQNSQEV